MHAVLGVRVEHEPRWGGSFVPDRRGAPPYPLVGEPGTYTSGGVRYDAMVARRYPDGIEAGSFTVALVVVQQRHDHTDVVIVGDVPWVRPADG